MSLFGFGQKKNETMTSAYIAKRWAETFSLKTLNVVREWHNLPPESPKPFLALAALSVLGFSIGIAQESVASKINQQIRDSITENYMLELVHKYFETAHEPKCELSYIIHELLALGKQISNVFFANANDRNHDKPPPHYYAAKALCSFLENGKEACNPEEVLTFAKDLQDGVISTKELFEEMLAIGIEFVE
jgi:hypothetical protein